MSVYARDEIIQHFKNPQNYGEIKNSDMTIKHLNPLCGDEQEWFFIFDKSGTKENWVIKDVKFQGSGCAISTASASILSEHIKGKTVKDIQKIKISDILNILGLDNISSSRIKCVNLPLDAIKKAMS